MVDVPYKRLEEANMGSTDDAKICQRRNVKRILMPFICLLLVGIITWHAFPVFEIVSYQMPELRSNYFIFCPTNLPDFQTIHVHSQKPTQETQRFLSSRQHTNVPND